MGSKRWDWIGSMSNVKQTDWVSSNWVLVKSAWTYCVAKWSITRIIPGKCCMFGSLEVRRSTGSKHDEPAPGTGLTDKESAAVVCLVGLEGKGLGQ